MKQVLYVMALGALFLGLVQTMNAAKIPVTVEKTDNADTKKVTVTIFGQKKNKISSATFTKNKDKATKKLFFNFDNDENNVIHAFYKEEASKEESGQEKSSTLDKLKKTAKSLKSQKSVVFDNQPIINKQQGQQGGTITLDMKTKKIALLPPLETTEPIVKATLKLPVGSGSWTIISANKDYSQGASQSNRAGEMGILQKGIFSSSKNHKISLYQDKDIKIYAQKKGQDKPTITIIPKNMVDQASKNPVLIIADDGTASVASASAAAGGSAQSSAQSSANKVTPPTLSEHIALKHLLLNKGGKLPWKQFYTQNGDVYKFNQEAATALMNQELNKTLVETPYVAQKLSNVMLATPTFYDAKKQAVRKLQGEYDAVYTVLLDSKETIADKETKQIKVLRTAVINALK